MSKASFPFEGWNRIWPQLDQMLKFGRKVTKVADPETQIGIVKLEQHINRLETLFDTFDDKQGPCADAAFGILELSALCQKAMNDLVDNIDPEIETGVWIKIVRE